MTKSTDWTLWHSKVIEDTKDRTCKDDTVNLALQHITYHWHFLRQSQDIDAYMKLCVWCQFPDRNVHRDTTMYAVFTILFNSSYTWSSCNSMSITSCWTRSGSQDIWLLAMAGSIYNWASNSCGSLRHFPHYTYSNNAAKCGKKLRTAGIIDLQVSDCFTSIWRLTPQRDIVWQGNPSSQI